MMASLVFNVLTHTVQDSVLILAYLFLNRIKKQVQGEGIQKEVMEAGFLLMGQEVFERYLRPVSK